MTDLSTPYGVTPCCVYHSLLRPLGFVPGDPERSRALIHILVGSRSQTGDPEFENYVFPCL